jgi:hypothetical protein
VTDIPPTDPGTEADHQAGATPFDPGAPSGLTKDQEVGHYIEMWKQAVAVQMHFNDIEWRIRGLALTVATFALGASGVAAKDGTRIWWFSLGSVIILIGLLLWYGFYFVDRIWYHPLLKAAVEQGTEIENEIKESLPRAGMTATITARSPQQRTRFIQRLTGKPPEMHSDDKLVRFYTIGASALIIAAAALQVGVLLGAEPAP